MNQYQEIRDTNINDNKEYYNPIRRMLPLIVLVMIFMIFIAYSYSQRQIIVSNTEYLTDDMTENMANSIASEFDYAQSSIRLVSVTIAQTMTSDTLENPAEVILPMVDSTPFGGIEYIRADGMNVMNIGDPFDASDRVYYIEGIKGNTGTWNNYHPKTSKETLMNFYTPLVYKDKITGVITGYIKVSSQISPVFRSKLYGRDNYGLLIDENDMIICTTENSEFVPDYTLDMMIERIEASKEKKDNLRKILSGITDGAVPYEGPKGEGRVCVKRVPGTSWRVAIIVPAESFESIINENTETSANAVMVISLILIAYAAYVILSAIKRRKEVAEQNARLEEENRIINEENQRAFNELSEVRDIIASADMGTWRIELVEGEEPRMYVDATMKKLLGITGQEKTPEQTYTDWYSNIQPDAVPSVLKSVERMQQGYFDENTYLWIHPTKGVRYVRCGGTSQNIEGGYSLRGYHYDVDDVVREDQAKVVMLQEALAAKDAYHTTLGKLGDIFYSMHVVDLKENTVIEFNAQNEVKEIVNHKLGAVEMMIDVMTAVTVDDYKESALEFTDLTTIADRMKDKRIISKQFVGKHIGWFLASFIMMEADEEGRPTKIIYTTRVIDEEKKQEEKLIKKSQTDELTGLLNRRAYEEDIYAHNDTPDEEHFIYVSMDVNGLKVVNDTLGHMAGDELIVGACHCMKKCLGSYGKLYRIGGDEFVGILFVTEDDLEPILHDFDEAMANWSGKLVDSMSISYGWISKEEQPGASVRQLGAVAEERMYAAKSEHYRKTGVDRRGQQAAHKALCELYTKILRINLTEDSYHIINMDVLEQTAEKGFADKISEWLQSFGRSGQVHPDDLGEYLEKTDIEYLKKYFSDGKTSLHIFYRRKYEDGFKQVMMEIIPTKDYSEDAQSFYLYVKSIDK